MDVGQGTDLRATRRAYPQTKISAWIDVAALARMSREEIDGMVVRMLEEVSTCSALSCPAELVPWIGVAEVGPDVSDQTVRNLLTVPERVRLR